MKHIDLGRNKIEKIEGLDNQLDLRELRLWANKIRKIEDISQLSKLRILSISVDLS